VVILSLALALARESSVLASGGRVFSRSWNIWVRSTWWIVTFGWLSVSHFMCSWARSCWFMGWRMGRVMHIVGLPVWAQRVEVTAESMPPDMPIT